MHIRKAVIPAAGVGTRLLPATKSQPKEMLPVGRKPTIQYVVEELFAAGIKEILIITSQQKRAIEDHFDSDPELVKRLKKDQKSLEVLNHIGLDISLFYTRQSEPTGLADAIGLAESFVGDEDFVVSLGDSIINSKNPGSLLRRLIRSHTKHRASATIVFETVEPEEVVKYGIADTRGNKKDNFEVYDLIEKPKIEDAPSTLAIAARYIFSPKIFNFIKQTPVGRGGEVQITDSMRLMLKAGERIWGLKLASDELRYDIGNFQNYFEAFFDFSINDPELGDRFRKYAEGKLKM